PERQVADAERARELLQLLSHCRGRAGDDVALLAQLFPALVGAQIEGRVADLRDDAGAHRSLAHVTGRTHHARVEMEALVEEVVDVRPPLALAVLVALADAHLLEERRRVRVLRLAALRHVLPVAVHHPLRALVAAEGEVAVVVAALDAEIPGLDRAQAGDPDR